MDAREIYDLTELLTRVAVAARGDSETARQVREALARSGVLEVFGAAGTLDVVDLLDAGGEAVLRDRLYVCTLAELRVIIAAHQYDAEKATTRWRSATRLIDFIVTHATQQLADEHAVAEARPAALVPSWML